MLSIYVYNIDTNLFEIWDDIALLIMPMDWILM